MKATQRLADELEALLDRNPPEEEIHTFIAAHPGIFGHEQPSYASTRVIQGLLSKFPITPDRVPDFLSVAFMPGSMQFPSRIYAYELKRADCALFATHARLSKDLNDAWMEGVESLRLIGLNYSDFVRRAIKKIAATQNATLGDNRLTFTSDHNRPRCGVRILIGRRASLAPEDVMRVRELAFTTNFSIVVATYDSLLDELRGKEEGELTGWGW
jgi:hypothetical protein